MSQNQFHTYEQRVRRELEILKRERFYGNNAVLLQEFYLHLHATGISKLRIAKYLFFVSFPVFCKNSF